MVLQGKLMDGSEAFYSMFCANLKQSGTANSVGDCDKYIYPPFGADTGSPGLNGPATPPPHTILVFVTGIFGECVKGIATPFSDSYSTLLKQGYQSVLVPPVEGRSSTERNATIIDGYLTPLIHADDRVIVLGYSKGVPDLMYALDAYRDHLWVRNTVAFISVEGVVMGTPLGDRYRDLYDRLLKRIPFNTCPPGDGKGVDSLTTVERQTWLQNHVLPAHIARFSVTAVAQPGEMNPLLESTYDTLSDYTILNDGQVRVSDAILPDSYFLGTLKGDHWAVAMPFSISKKLVGHVLAVNNAYPRHELINTILQYVNDLLSREETVHH
jgi:hypothetical protein